jgi:hypothetical protein
MAIVAETPALEAQRTGTGRPRLGFFRRRFGRWIALGQYGFPFSVGRYTTPIGRFRAMARRTRFAGRGQLLRIPLEIAMTLAWPVGALLGALQICRHPSMRGRRFGSAQFLDMYWLALRHSIPPLEYAFYHFENLARRKEMHEYVYWNDLPALAALTKRSGADIRDVQDKDRFADICARHSLPHVPTLAVFDRGAQIYPAAPFVPNAPVLWTKALRLKGGAGSAKWIKDGEDYCDMYNRRVRADKLAGEFQKRDCLVQPFVENHPDIASVTNWALACLRIVTGIDEDAKTQYVTSLFGLSHGARETPIATILCRVAADSGHIQFAAMVGGEPVVNHPDTGAPIIGIRLPFWRESVDLVRRAHAAAFPRFPFLGWDIALTKEGPILLETNYGWGAIFHQMLDGPLGRTAFSSLVSQYV